MFGGAEVMERDRLNMEIERIFNLRHRHLNQFIGVIQVRYSSPGDFQRIKMIAATTAELPNGRY